MLMTFHWRLYYVARPSTANIASGNNRIDLQFTFFVQVCQPFVEVGHNSRKVKRAFATSSNQHLKVKRCENNMRLYITSHKE